VGRKPLEGKLRTQRDLQFQFLVVPPHAQLDLFPGLLFQDASGQVGVPLTDRFLVHGQDHVPFAQASLVGGTAGLDSHDLRPVFDRLVTHPQVGAYLYLWSLFRWLPSLVTGRLWHGDFDVGFDVGGPSTSDGVASRPSGDEPDPTTQY